MFGYVKVFRPELKVCEYDQYKAVYCSLCQTLGKRYGFASRMTLSYDFAFLSVFLMSLRDENPSFSKGRCIFHPFKKRMLCAATSSLEFAADVAVLLTYHKLCDTVHDEHGLKRIGALILKLLYYKDFKKAIRRRPIEAKAAECFMKDQWFVEQSTLPCVDACAEPTATFLSMLASHEAPTEEVRECAARFGYCLGRFIYLADAAQDLQDDLINGSFNPYLVSDSKLSADNVSDIKRYAAESLHACVAVCTECLDELPIQRFKGILYNVLFKGMPFVIQQICDTKQEESHCEKSV